MTCPSCSKPPMAFLKYFFSVDPSEVTCRHCSSQLAATPAWSRYSRYSYWTSIGMAIVLALLGLGFLYLDDFPVIVIGYTVVFMIVFGILVDVVAWFQFRYEVKKGDGTLESRE